jgi:RNA polymerase-interacting CarD/CdnL/TRCF family regulator
MKIQESKIRKPMTQEDLDKVIKILKDKYKLFCKKWKAKKGNGN